MGRQFRHAQLERRVAAEAPALSRRVIGAFLGRHFDAVDVVHHQFGDRKIAVLDGGQAWRVQRNGTADEGRGPIGLIACVFGVTPGTAARMILEAAAATRLPAEIAQAVQIAIDAGGVAAGGRMVR